MAGVCETDLLRDALLELSLEIREASRRLAEHVKQNGDDPAAYRMADRIMVALSEERRYRRMLAQEISG